MTKTSGKSMSKSEMISQLADKTGLDKKACSGMLDALSEIITEQLSKKGPGVVAVAGLVKISAVKRPARKAGTKPNPFKPGETMEVKARPATTVAKVRALKRLKDAVV